MSDTTDSRLRSEAKFQDDRMLRAIQGEQEIRDRFYFINRAAYDDYLSLLRGLVGRRVVVVGCSDGGVTPLAREKAYVEGIDISPVSIEKLRAAIAKEGLSAYASARLMDAMAVEYPERSVDAISCSGVLHHLDTERALRSWASCLKDDGFVALFEPLAFHPLAALFRLVTPGMRTPDEHPLRPSDFALMRKYFARVDGRYYGLTTVCCAAIAVIPGASVLARKMLPAFESLDRILLKGLPFLRHLCWLTVVRLASPTRSVRT
jgi:SAM-dependent methyltransferase